MEYFTQSERDQYSFGDCNIFAIALSRITGKDMVGIYKEAYLPEEEKCDDDDVLFEFSHAALFIDEEHILDVHGIRKLKDVINTCLWNKDPSEYVSEIQTQLFQTIEEEDLSSYFASYEEELIIDAIEKIKASKLLKLIK